MYILFIYIYTLFWAIFKSTLSLTVVPENISNCFYTLQTNSCILSIGFHFVSIFVYGKYMYSEFVRSKPASFSPYST